MKCILTAVFAFTVAFTSTALAQCPPPPSSSSLAEGQIGLFFDQQGTQTCSSGGATTLYVVARVPAGGLKGFVMPYLQQVSGPKVTFLGGPGLPPGSPFLAGGAFDWCASAYAPAANPCPVAQGDLVVIAQRSVLFAPSSGIACFQTICPSNSGIIPIDPRYVRCDSSEGQFTGGASMCIGFGESPVAVEPITWGAVKEMYR
jgi:hypothetical protein